MTAMPRAQALRCFVAVASEGSVSGAARKLNLSQPAVSLQIKGLEEATRLQLFTRTSQGLEVTRAGTALLPQAEAALAAIAGFQRAAFSHSASAREVLRIGTILDPEFTRLGAFFKEFVEAAPTVEAQLRHGMSDDVLAQVARGELDVGFYLDLPANVQARTLEAQDGRGKRVAFRSLALRRFAYLVMAPPGWERKVAGKRWKALAGLPWLSTPPASAHRRFLAAVFRPLGVEPKRVAMTDDEASMLDLLESGIGLSLVRESVAMHAAQARGLVIADRVQIDAIMTFVCLEARAGERPIAEACLAMKRAWAGLPLAEVATGASRR